MAKQRTAKPRIIVRVRVQERLPGFNIVVDDNKRPIRMRCAGGLVRHLESQNQRNGTELTVLYVSCDRDHLSMTEQNS
jgi:hypothetical protein